jgi:hypothetical protein
MVAIRLGGQELSRGWSVMTPSERQRSIVELAECLRALHTTQAPLGVLMGADADSPHPLPVDHLLQLLGEASRRPGYDRHVLAAAAERLITLSDVLDQNPTTLIHGDLHLENVEWSRPGPPDLDLDVLLHSLADPALHVESGDGGRLQRRDFDEVVGWLRGAYPELFANPRLPDRLWVYRLAYEVRCLLAEPLRGPGSLPHYHPFERIRLLVADRSDLSWFLAL